GDEHLAPYALLLAGSLLVFGLVVEEIVEGGVVRHRHSGVMSVRDSRRRGENGNLGNYIAFVTYLRTPRCRRPTLVRRLTGNCDRSDGGAVTILVVTSDVQQLLGDPVASRCAQVLLGGCRRAYARVSAGIGIRPLHPGRERIVGRGGHRHRRVL